jgi:hypothetical protein
MLVLPGSLDKSDFQRNDGPLIFISRQKTVVTVGTYDSEFSICQIVFNKKDGSIFLTVPYLRTSGGVLCVATFPADYQPGTPVTFSITENGKTTRRQAKFTHHPDGNTHFSQDGRMKTVIRRPSFPLDSIGTVFQLHIYRPYGFDDFNPITRDLKKAYLRNKFTGTLPEAVVIEAEWRRKADIIANIYPPGQDAGPKTRVKHRKTGVESTVFFVGQPRGYPLQDHVLMISVRETAPVPSITVPTMLLLAGFDPHEVKDGDPAVQQTGCLAWLYPAYSLDDFEMRLGTVDWDPPAVS